MAGARELLVAERERTLRRVVALEREFASIAEAAGSAGTDDEHDPEGATLAFERQHAAALLEQAREHLAAIDAALDAVQAGRPACAARPAAEAAGRAGRAPGYSARSANAVRVRAAQPAGSSAPATALTSPASASRTSSAGRYTLSMDGGRAVWAALPMTGSM